MGIEKKTVTGRVDPENEALVNAVHEALSAFDITKSSAINILLGVARQQIESGAVDFREMLRGQIKPILREAPGPLKSQGNEKKRKTA